MSRRLNLIIKLPVFLIIFLKVVNASFPLYDKFYQSQKVCNYSKPKVTNKVPTYELCSFNETTWEDLVFRNDDDTTTFCNVHKTIGNNLTEKAIPTKILVYKDWVFIVVTRVLGVYSTLNYFRVSEISNDKYCPQLKCYPNCAVNQLAVPGICPLSGYYLTNVVDFQMDKCGVLWVLDVGAFLTGSIFEPVSLQNPQICRYNTSITDPLTDPLKECTSIPSTYHRLTNVYGYSTIIVNTIDGCDNAFAYIFNILGGFLLVFSLKTKEFWVFNAPSLLPEPDDSQFEVVLPDYTRKRYIVWSGAAGFLDDNNLNFCPKPSTQVSTVPQTVLNKKSNANIPGSNYNFKNIGTLNEKGQINSLVSFEDVVFGAQEQNYAIVCYNKKDGASPDAIKFLIQDRIKYPSISDMRLNSDKPGCKQVFFLTNNQLDISCNGLNPNLQNFRIFYFNVKEALQLYPECKSYYKDVVQGTPPIYSKPQPVPQPILQYQYQFPIIQNRQIPTCQQKAKSQYPPSPTYKYVPASANYNQYKTANYSPYAPTSYAQAPYISRYGMF